MDSIKPILDLLVKLGAHIIVFAVGAFLTFSAFAHWPTATEHSNLYIGVALSILAIGIVFIIYVTYRSSKLSNQKKTLRGNTLQEATNEVGLVDIEERVTDHSLPPIEFYKAAQKEIFIVGPTLRGTFANDQLNTLDKSIYILMLHPDTANDALNITDDKVDLKAEVLMSLRIIKAKGFFDRGTKFQVRFLKNLPPCLGIMIDGNLQDVGNITDAEGQIRIQPLTHYKTIHKGLICQFSKKAIRNANIFDMYAIDFRKLWEFAIQDQTLIDQIPAS